MIEWLTANAGVPNGLMLIFATGCVLALAFSSWALRMSSSRLQQATAFYEAYLAGDLAESQPNVDQGDRK